MAMPRVAGTASLQDAANNPSARCKQICAVESLWGTHPNTHTQTHCRQLIEESEAATVEKLKWMSTNASEQ